MNQLTRLEEFRSILDTYTPSKKAVKLLRAAKVALLIGPTSSGRNTIIKELVKSGKYTQFVSDTTRKRRTNNGKEELDGSEYYFINEEHFLEGLRNGDYIEAEIIHGQQVSGVRAEEIKQKSRTGRIIVNEVEIDGAEKYKALADDVQLFFIIPPNFDEWMSRMRNRGDMDPDEFKRRLKSAEAELQHALDTDFYIYVINERYQVATTEIMSVMAGRPIDQEEHKQRAWQLLNELKRHLSS